MSIFQGCLVSGVPLYSYIIHNLLKYMYIQTCKHTNIITYMYVYNIYWQYIIYNIFVAQKAICWKALTSIYILHVLHHPRYCMGINFHGKFIFSEILALSKFMQICKKLYPYGIIMNIFQDMCYSIFKNINIFQHIHVHVSHSIWGDTGYST